MKSFAVLIAVFGLTLAFPVSVLAHQSGCHRWHSCPSDSDSYSCGDLGYDSECGMYEVYEEPDYFAQGSEDGLSYVGKNSSYITATAESNGNEKGMNDGESGDLEDDSSDSDDTCSDVKFENDTSPQDYYDGFMDTYRDGCVDMYNEKYSAAYASAYQTGNEKHAALLAADTKLTEEEATAKNNGSDWSGFLWLAALASPFVVAGNWDTIKRKLSNLGK